MLAAHATTIDSTRNLLLCAGDERIKAFHVAKIDHDDLPCKYTLHMGSTANGVAAVGDRVFATRDATIKYWEIDRLEEHEGNVSGRLLHVSSRASHVIRFDCKLWLVSLMVSFSLSLLQLLPNFVAAFVPDVVCVHLSPHFLVYHELCSPSFNVLEISSFASAKLLSPMEDHCTGCRDLSS